MIFSRQLGWIGVDVGTHAVKLAQVMRDGAQVRLHRAAVIERPASWSSDNTLANEQPITSYPEIRAALECGGFSGRSAVCTLPMNLCELRGLNLPPGNDHERHTMAADELAEDWAERKTPLEFDFWELDTGRAEKSTDTFNVNILAAARPWIVQLWRDCRQSGLDCWAIDGVPLALARAVGLVAGRDSTRRALAVDWGFSNTTLAIVGESRAWYSRRIPDCAFHKVLNAVMDMFDVTLEQAQHLVDAYGLTSSMSTSPIDQEIQPAITAAASDALEQLVRQLARTLQFAESQRRHLQPEAVWLMGGGASMRNINHYLTEALKLPVHVWTLSAADATPIECATDNRSALFGGAVALSSLAWRAA